MISRENLEAAKLIDAAITFAALGVIYPKGALKLALNKLEYELIHHPDLETEDFLKAACKLLRKQIVHRTEEEIPF